MGLREQIRTARHKVGRVTISLNVSLVPPRYIPIPIPSLIGSANVDKSTNENHFTEWNGVTDITFPERGGCLTSLEEACNVPLVT